MAKARVTGHSWDELHEQSEQFAEVVEHCLASVVDRAVTRLTRGLTAAGESPDDLGDIAGDWASEVNNTLAPYILATYQSGALTVAHNLVNNLEIPEGQGLPGVSNRLASDYLAGATNRMVGLGDELWNLTRSTLVEGMQNGESIEDLANRVRTAADVTHARANTVARTEIVSASNTGSYQQAALVLGEGEKKEWLATEDSRTREDHVIADHQTVGINEMFMVGGYQMAHPGDVTAPAGEVINCRCTIAYVFDDDVPPTTTCSCEADVVTAAYMVSQPPPVSLSKPDVCVAPTSLISHEVTLPPLTTADEQAIYDAFKSHGPISPAYGGAKIYKHLQEMKSKGQTALDEFQTLKVVDKVYAATGGKSSFAEKFDEWLDGPAGKKATNGLKKPSYVKQSTNETLKHIDEVLPPEPTPPLPPPPPPHVSTEPPKLPVQQPSGDPLSIEHVAPATIKSLYDIFYTTKPVTPGWGGAAIYKNLQAIKADLAKDPQFHGLNDAQLLKMLDKAFTGKTGKTYFDEVNTWLGTPAGKKYAQATGSSPAGAPQPSAKTSPPPGAPDLGVAGDISGITNTAKFHIFSKFKGKGVYLSSTPEKMWDALQAIKEEDTPGWTTGLSDLQIIRVIDEQSAVKFGVPNANLYENKIVTWLKTPSGKSQATAAKNEPKPLKEMPTLTRNISAKDNDFPVLTTTQALQMQNAQEPWTAAQRAALRKYTGSSYHDMNGVLRNPSRSVTPGIKTANANAQAGMRPSTRPMVVHRGMGPAGLGFSSSEMVSPAALKALVGKTMQDKGFMSTSVGGRSAFSGTIILEIQCPTGTPMAYVDHISSHRGENEMLLAAGTKYKVQSVDTIHGAYGLQYKVTVRVVP